MDYTQKLNEIYKLYSDNKYSEAKSLNDTVLLGDPSNIYANRYKNLLEQKIKSELEPKRK